MGHSQRRPGADWPRAQAEGSTVALLGPTNTGKTHRAVEQLLAHATGMIGLPLRLLAQEIYDRVVASVGAATRAIPRRCYPLLAIAFAVAWQCAIAGPGADMLQAVLDGVVVGLAASGLYSGAVKPALASSRGAS